MKVYGYWRYSCTILDLYTRWRWWLDSRTWDRARGIHRKGGWVGPRASLDTVDRRKFCCSCLESNPLCQACNVVTIPTELSLVIIIIIIIIIYRAAAYAILFVTLLSAYIRLAHKNSFTVCGTANWQGVSVTRDMRQMLCCSAMRWRCTVVSESPMLCWKSYEYYSYT
jgi:hypothetical protein